MSQLMSSCIVRRPLKTRHIWERVKIQWHLLENRLFTKHPTGLEWNQLYSRLFCNIYDGSMKWKEDRYHGSDYWQVRHRWQSTKEWFAQSRMSQHPPFLGLSLHFDKFDEKDDPMEGTLGKNESTREGTTSRKSTTER